MARNGRKWVRIITWTVCILVTAGMTLNWLMTYNLEDSLRKRLKSEIVNATDSLYDFSFDALDVGLFSGELTIRGLSFFPDSAALSKRKDNNDLPEFYFNVDIDTIYFKGINLTWRFYYRELSFSEFNLKKPSIKITTTKQKSSTQLSVDSPPNQSLYDLASRYFDVIHAQNINFENAQIEYIAADTTTFYYKLQHFRFTAQNFILDKYSPDRGKLLYCDNFKFETDTPQSVFDSEHLQLEIDQIKLNTIDSTMYVEGVHLQSKDKYWQQKLKQSGNYSLVKVNGVELNGIAFSRKRGLNFLDSRELNIKHPEIEYYNTSSDETPKTTDRADISGITTWSLYSLTSPLLEQLIISKISLTDAKLKYATTKDKQVDMYTLNSLDFEASRFIVDSISDSYNIIKYVRDFKLSASDVQIRLESNNSETKIDSLILNTIDKNIDISHIHFSPLTSTPGRNRISGDLYKFQVDGIKYKDGLEAESIKIVKPNINFTKGSGKHSDNNGQTQKMNKDIVNNFLDAITPFVNYVSVKNIIVENGNAVYTDQASKNRYSLNNLDFYARNFHLDKETRRLRDYFFSWDEYDIRFQNFDNITPDQKYRIQIARGEFNSISKNILLDNMKITPLRRDTYSYIEVATPYARLLGWDEKRLKDRRLSFGSLIMEVPIIRVVKKDEKTNTKKENHTNNLQHIEFDKLSIASPSVSFEDTVKKHSLQAGATLLTIDSFSWELDKELFVNDLTIDRPHISIVADSKDQTTNSSGQDATLPLGDIRLNKVNIKQPIVEVTGENTDIHFSTGNYLLESFFWSRKDSPIFKIKNFELLNPTLSYTEKSRLTNHQNNHPTRKIKDIIAAHTDDIRLGRVSISNFNLLHHKEESGKRTLENRLVDTDLLIENFHGNLSRKEITVEGLNFSTHDIDLPLADSFYTFKIDHIDFNKKNGVLTVDNIRLKPNYPKFDFAYIHPRGADWFNVEIDKIKLSGINTDKLIADSILLVKKMEVNRILLENLKNQKITIEHNKMPLLYEHFQKFPLKYLIDDLDIRDVTVLYEELARNGYQPARIPFREMNGRVSSFTNIQRNDSAFYTLYAHGLLMDSAPFTAEWKIPVDSLNDKFFLTADIQSMNMTDFNQLIRPMAPALIGNGRIDRLKFHTEASSVGAVVDMEFVYDSLHLVVLNNMFTDQENKLYTRIVNRWGLESRNMGSSLRTPKRSIVRDPYHSNFNYFWQILQPPLTESVGVTEEKENIAHNLLAIYNRIRKLLGKEKKDKKPIE